MFFLIGIYGGFIQAGTGFFIMAAGLLHHRFDLIKTNLYKALVMFTYTIAAVLMFMWKGDILWLQKSFWLWAWVPELLREYDGAWW